MPFIPWKKNRVTPISEILADLQSPKHASSLLVETGFPTSVIDLFSKNRTRFRKPKYKKPVRREISDLPPPPPLPLISPAPPPPPNLPETSSSSGFTVVSSEDPSLTPLVIANDNGNGDDGVSGSGPEVFRVGEYDGGSGSKTVFAAILKMFVVAVVLITRVKHFIVGITISTFWFLFLENAGKRVVSCLSPCSDANVGIIRCLAEKICSCVWCLKLCEGSESLIVEGENNIVVSELDVGSECSPDSLSFEEIEVVEKKSEVVGVCCEETCMQEDSNVKVVDSCEISQCKIKDSSSSVKLKSKMVKKLVPKKLRGSKKDKREKKSKEMKDETNSEVDKSMNFEIEEKLEGVQKVEVENEIRSQLLLKNELEEVDHRITCSQDSSLARVEEVVVISEEKRIDRVGNSGYTILFVIALAGLVVGRFPAMILTVAWCFMLKIVTTPEISQNVPLIQCSVQKS